ncbi:hypothetical protein NH340_JMT00069 [Sarcoptes scabiei]|nr:hypothetical protein NH340_JMT00069 [Sarcoptes scabiei]
MVINQKRSISYNGIEIDRNELNLIIHRLLCELNQNGSKVNEYSAKKSKLIQQLQSDIDGMNEINSSETLRRYFEIIFQLEKCQLKMEQYQLERSDIEMELYLTKKIILNMISYGSTNGIRYCSRFRSMVKRNLSKLKQRTLGAEKNKTSLRRIVNFFIELPFDTKSFGRKNALYQSEQNFLTDKSFDLFDEIKQKMRSKLIALQKNQKSNENCSRKLSIEYDVLREKLKQFYQYHLEEMIAEQQKLDSYLKNRVRASEIQIQIVSLDEMIRWHRQQYRNTMERLKVLSQKIHLINSSRESETFENYKINKDFNIRSVL